MVGICPPFVHRGSGRAPNPHTVPESRYSQPTEIHIAVYPTALHPMARVSIDSKMVGICPPFVHRGSGPITSYRAGKPLFSAEIHIAVYPTTPHPMARVSIDSKMVGICPPFVHRGSVRAPNPHTVPVSRYSQPKFTLQFTLLPPIRWRAREFRPILKGVCTSGSLLPI